MGELGLEIRYFDLEAGKPLTEEAAEPQLEAGHDTVKFIGELLLAPEFPYHRTDFKDPDIKHRVAEAKNWTPEQARAYGSWVQSLIETDDGTERTVQQEHIDRLSTMGLGPRYVRLLRQAGAATLAEFRLQIGVAPGRQSNRYASWDIARYQRYAHALSTRLGRMLTAEDLDANAAKLEGPSYMQVCEGPVKGLQNLNETIGYPDVSKWEAADVVFWGAKVRRANEGKPFSGLMFKVLAGRRRGPSDHLVYGYFTNWADFKARVDEQYDRDEEARAAGWKRKHERYTEMIASGEFASETADFDDIKLFAYGGKYVTAQELAPRLTSEQLQEIAGKSPSEFAAKLQKLNKALTAGHIEVKADRLEVFDDIWPLPDGSEYLRVTDVELAEARRLKNELWRRYYAKKRSA